ncbi:MAG: DUF1330 domain-containing protein [Cyclobacteriaceae bacterium]|nr:DUF1330 domain-containing protein [Cyclobacteriaceae bacterium]
MKGYCLFDNVLVHDLEKLEQYKKLATPLVARYDGKYIILGGQFTVVEGSVRPTFLVMIEFPSYEKANQWYYSEEYRELKNLRFSAVDSNAIIVEGL